MNVQFEQFLDKQEGIYWSFRNGTDEIGVTKGLDVDTGGTSPQSAFLISWRFPENIGLMVEEFSEEVADAIPAIIYGPRNAHTTVSDFGLKKDVLIDPIKINKYGGGDDEATLFTLAAAVRSALEASKDQLKDCSVEFGEFATKGANVLALGVSNEAVWAVNEAIKNSSETRGKELKGSWGNHMTVSRFLEDAPVNSPKTERVINLVRNTKAFGIARPTAIEVGYFNTDQTSGFVLSTYKRFELGK